MSQFINGFPTHPVSSPAAKPIAPSSVSIHRAAPSPATSTGTSPPASARLATRSLHGDPRRRGRSGPLVGAIAQSTTFHQSRIGETGGPTYSRVANPSVDELEDVLGALEDAPPAIAFGTGLGAETALFLALLRAGDHAVVGQAVYGGTTRLFRQVLSELGITSTFVDSSNPIAIRDAITPRTKLVFIETPANPTLDLTDIAAVAAITRAAGVPLAVDNTFLTPVLQRPLDLGADISVYSTTKLIEGHSTACGGTIVSRDEELNARVRWIRKCTGGIQAPFSSWLTTRGLKTLPLRIREQSRYSQIIAEWLESHPAIARVNYPGLPAFRGHEIARRQHLENLHGAVISFEVAGGIPAAVRVLEGVRLCSLVEHVGSVETLLTHPATMTHADVPPEQRRAAGLSDGLIRLSVGLEEPDAVIEDLEQAITRAADAVETVKAVKGGAACAAL
ncbi:MAG: aminotransferase class I/II-fold pyridoxal phosphate-dependent enzyme [Phycisphaerales bacterium]|nr:aminotransferase class I/II-fold pyridoxal phosphate-dependent enzyme [Phycisphaerales bacterium]